MWLKLLTSYDSIFATQNFAHPHFCYQYLYNKLQGFSLMFWKYEKKSKESFLLKRLNFQQSFFPNYIIIYKFKIKKILVSLNPTDVNEIYENPMINFSKWADPKLKQKSVVHLVTIYFF